MCVCVYVCVCVAEYPLGVRCADDLRCWCSWGDIPSGCPSRGSSQPQVHVTPLFILKGSTFIFSQITRLHILTDLPLQTQKASSRDWKIPPFPSLPGPIHTFGSTISDGDQEMCPFSAQQPVGALGNINSTETNERLDNLSLRDRKGKRCIGGGGVFS